MRKDFELYLLKIQRDVNKMNKCIEEANELAKKGEMPQDTAEFIANQSAILEANLNRLMYCKYLLDLPPKFIQKIKYKRYQKQLESFKAKSADEDSVVAEDEQAIENVKAIITSEGE